MKLSSTALALSAKYGTLVLTMDQLSQVIHWEPRSILNAVSDGTFPIPTFKTGRVRVAHVNHVAAYLDAKAEQAEQEWKALQKRLEPTRV